MKNKKLLFLTLLFATLAFHAKSHAEETPTEPLLQEEEPLKSKEEIKAELIKTTQNDPEKSFLVKGDMKFVDLEKEQDRLSRETAKIQTDINISNEIVARIEEMKEIQSSLSKEVSKKVSSNDQLKYLVTLYESINAEQATAILKQLPSSLSVSVLALMNPKKSSKILATMDPYMAADMSRKLLKESQLRLVASGGKP